MQPTVGELLDVIAVVMEDNDHLCEQCGLAPHDGHRVFTRADRQRGHNTEPTATLDSNGDLSVNQER